MALGIEQIIGESYNMLWKNRTVLKIGIMIAIISALLSVALNIVSAPLTALENTLQNSTSMSNLSVIVSTAISVAIETAIISIMFFLVSLVFSGALLSAASAGDKADLGASFACARSRYISLLGTSIICGLIVLGSIAPGFVLIISGAVLSGAAGGALLILGGILLVVLVVYITLRLWVADAAAVVGGYGTVESVKRSWTLTKGNLWRIFAIVLLTGLISGVVGGIVGYALKYVISMASPLVGTFVGDFVTAVAAIPISVAMVLVYMQLAGPVKEAGQVRAQTRKSLK